MEEGHDKACIKSFSNVCRYLYVNRPKALVRIGERALLKYTLAVDLTLSIVLPTAHVVEHLLFRDAR